MKKIIALAVGLMLFMSGCASYDANVDETAIEQEGYIMFKADKKLVDCYSPGTTGWGGVGNDVFYYPAGQRTFSFTGQSSEAEMDPVKVVTEGQTLQVPGFVKFTLTQDCDALYDFHRKVGVKYQAYENSGWTNLLNDYMGVAVTSAMNDAADDYGWQEIYTNSSVRAEMEKELNEVLQSRINSSLGGDWIKVNGVSLSKPQVSQELQTALESAEKAKLENEAQKQKNETIRTKYQTIGDCKKVASEDWCAIFFLADNNKIDLLPIPDGGNLNVSPRN